MRLPLPLNESSAALPALSPYAVTALIAQLHYTTLYPGYNHSFKVINRKTSTTKSKSKMKLKSGVATLYKDWVSSLQGMANDRYPIIQSAIVAKRASSLSHIILDVLDTLTTCTQSSRSCWSHFDNQVATRIADFVKATAWKSLTSNHQTVLKQLTDSAALGAGAVPNNLVSPDSREAIKKWMDGVVSVAADVQKLKQEEGHDLSAIADAFLPFSWRERADRMEADLVPSEVLKKIRSTRRKAVKRLRQRRVSGASRLGRLRAIAKLVGNERDRKMPDSFFAYSKHVYSGGQVADSLVSVSRAFMRAIGAIAAGQRIGDRGGSFRTLTAKEAEMYRALLFFNIADALNASSVDEKQLTAVLGGGAVPAEFRRYLNLQSYKEVTQNFEYLQDRIDAQKLPYTPQIDMRSDSHIMASSVPSTLSLSTTS